jgi:hypothetical protein
MVGGTDIMIRNRANTVLGLLVFWLMAPSAVLAQADSFEWSGQIPRGETIEVKGISGDIHAVLASGSTVEVVATKRGRRADFDEVDIEVVDEGDRIVVCAVYGSWNHDRGTCDHQDWDDDDRDRRWGEDGIDVSVDFEVRVPAGVRFEGLTVSGDVEALGLRSVVSATTVSGHVEVSTSETAWATTVNGYMDIEMGSTDWEELELSTVSGDITLRLPTGIDTDVRFSSLSGDFETDFNLSSESRRGRWIGSRVRGTIGDGGRTVRLNTVSGDVEILRAGSR